MEQGTIHFVGIGGIGMSALARILLERGEKITGSDVSGSPIVDQLRDAGALVTVGHDARNVNGARVVVVTSAVDEANPECIRAVERGIPVVHRGDMLAEMMRSCEGIAVCGTHGKTTTTAMTAAILHAAGVDATVALGGIDCATGTNAKNGTSSWFLAEADESDGSFTRLAPRIAVVTNIENDHLRSDDEVPALVAAFEQFLQMIPGDGTAIVGIDGMHARDLAVRTRRCTTVTTGLHSEAAVRAANVVQTPAGSAFDVIAGGVCVGSVELCVPGAINVQNALAAIATARALEVPFAVVARALHNFRGVHRRFEVLVRSSRMTVVDDYAHHPTAVAATIAAARAVHRGPVVAAFQPHRFTRTMYLAREFAAALRDADTVYLAPIYAASEQPIEGVTERAIGDPLRASGVDVRYVENVTLLPDLLLREAPRGALILMLGAGDIGSAAAVLARDVLAAA